MQTPFDEKPMPGAARRAILLSAVANAIAQARVLISHAKLQAMEIESERLKIQPVMPGKITDSERLARQHYDLEILRGTLNTYMGGLTGWQTGEGQQDQAHLFADVPLEVARYVQSIKDGVPYVMPVHTGD